MYPVNLILLFLFSLTSAINIDTTEKTDLVFAFMVLRHGDRTPDPEAISIIGLNDNEEINAQISPWGYGELTNAGKRTGYKTGQFIRRRYNDFIAPKYNESEIYIRSTDKKRTKITVLIVMSAVFPPDDDPWSKDINWEPVPYTTLPIKYDFNQASENCPEYKKIYSASVLLRDPRMDPYADLVNRVSHIIGVDLSNTPNLIAAVYDVYVSMDSLGYNIPNEIRKLMPELEEAVGVVWEIILGNKKILSLQVGPLLNEFFTYANQVIAGNDTQKVRVYSAHDLNIYSLLAASHVEPRLRVPKFGSLISLELRRVQATGQYVVLPVYLADPHVGTETYLTVQGCASDGELCAYDDFYALTAADLRTEDQWRSDCGFEAQ